MTTQEGVNRPHDDWTPWNEEPPTPDGWKVKSFKRIGTQADAELDWHERRFGYEWRHHWVPPQIRERPPSVPRNADGTSKVNADDGWGKPGGPGRNRRRTPEPDDDDDAACYMINPIRDLAADFTRPCVDRSRGHGGKTDGLHWSDASQQQSQSHGAFEDRRDPKQGGRRREDF